MKFKNVFWGLILILMGSLLIAKNMDIVYFDWIHFFKLWPVLFILWGISVLPVRDFIKVILLVIVLGGATWFVVDSSAGCNDDEFGFVFDDWKNNNQSMSKFQQSFTVPWSDTIKNAKLDLEAAAGSFQISDTSSQLIDFNQTGSKYSYAYTVKRTEGFTKVEISENNHSVFYRKHSKRVNIKLNPEPVWDINLEAGASAVRYDLSPFKIRELSIDGGAGSFKITLGDRYANTNLNIDAGASSIVIRIPETSACDLVISSVLSGKSFSGFEKLGDGHYQTLNYDSAPNKIHLDIETAVSSFTILRY